jgi:hypothetical protein
VARHHHPPLTPGRGTVALGALAAGVTAACVAVEWARVWRRGSAPLPSQTHAPGELLAAGRTATQETLAVFREGYRSGADRENALLHMLGSFCATFAGARAVTALIRSGRTGGLLGNLIVGDRHIHHYVPGFVLGFAAGGTAIAVDRPGVDRWMAVPFGAGAALVFDEAALLLELEDVYWSERGVLSLQLSFATIAGLAALALAARLLRRGEASVLVPAQAGGEPRRVAG